jgi:predicted dienelactone hydrolase
LVTSEFQTQAAFVARSLGMPDVPVVVLPHPVAGSGRANMRAVAEATVGAMLGALGRPA